MRAKEFIAEKQIKKYKSSDLGVDAAVALLNQHCSQAISMIEKPIWRGMTNHTTPIVTIDPSTGKRKSQNTSNQYTLLLDNSPYYQGWPKRSKSLICSTSKAYADRYSGGYAKPGGVYAIFPFDGVPIAMCPEEDMWYTKVHLPRLNLTYGTRSHPLAGLNRFFERLGLRQPTFKGMVQWTNSSTFRERLDEFNKGMNIHAVDALSPAEFLPYVLQQMAPENTDMQLLTIQEYASRKFSTQECWIGGPVVAIREDMYANFLDAVRKRDEANGTKQFYKDANAEMTPAEYRAWQDDRLLAGLGI